MKGAVTAGLCGLRCGAVLGRFVGQPTCAPYLVRSRDHCQVKLRYSEAEHGRVQLLEVSDLLLCILHIDDNFERRTLTNRNLDLPVARAYRN
jgi:hypothetical protein